MTIPSVLCGMLLLGLFFLGIGDKVMGFSLVLFPIVVLVMHSLVKKMRQELKEEKEAEKNN